MFSGVRRESSRPGRCTMACRSCPTSESTWNVMALLSSTSSVAHAGCGQLGLGRLGGQVDRLRRLTEALAPGVQEGVEDQAGQDDHQGLIDDLVARGERHPHGEQHADARPPRGPGPGPSR